MAKQNLYEQKYDLKPLCTICKQDCSMKDMKASEYNYHIIAENCKNYKGEK